MREFAISQGGSWVGQRAAECLLVLALAPAFAWISPFHSKEPPFFTRLGYWGGMIACWFLMMAIVDHLAEARGLLREARPFWRGVIKVGLTAFPMILVVAPATHAFTGWEASVSEVTELYFQIALLGGGISLISHAVLTPRPLIAEAMAAPALLVPPPEPAVLPDLAPADMPVPHAELAANGANRLSMRLPPHVRGPLVALEMEDHYVRVHTGNGSALLLLRLGDAILETAPTPGRQVHRSWWVADGAVAQFTRTGRSGQVRLANGLTAPVSQRYLKDLEALHSPPASS